jgi:uncharacterized membrane protein
MPAPYRAHPTIAIAAPCAGYVEAQPTEGEASAMSTGATIAIVAGAVILLLILLVAVRRLTARRRAERRLEGRRQEVAGAHRDAAQERTARADLAEREAQRARAEAEEHRARAALHEHGLADDQLDRDDEIARTERSESDRAAERH